VVSSDSLLTQGGGGCLPPIRRQRKVAGASQKFTVSCQRTSTGARSLRQRDAGKSVMTRFATLLGIGASLHSAGVPRPPIHRLPDARPVVRHIAHAGFPIFWTWPDPWDADLMEQQLELERQRADAEDRRAEAAEHSRSVEAQTPKGRPSTTIFAALPVGNPLAGTNAQTCSLDNGVTIQVSGVLRSDRCHKLSPQKAG
jgi:hypothetical protein